MNKLIASSLGLAAFAFAAACSAPPPAEPAGDQGEAASSPTEETSSSTGSAHADAGSHPTTTTTRPPSRDAAAAPLPSPSPGKGGKGGGGGKDDGTNNADPACMTACEALEKCSDLSFCEVVCTEAPDVVTCLATAPGCSKKDITACNEQENGPKGGGK